MTAAVESCVVPTRAVAPVTAKDAPDGRVRTPPSASRSALLVESAPPSAAASAPPTVGGAHWSILPSASVRFAPRVSVKW